MLCVSVYLSVYTYLCVPICLCMDMFCLYVFVCVSLPVLLMQYHYNTFESLLGDALQMYCIAVVSFDLFTHCDILYIFILLSFCIRKSMLR